MRDDLRHFIDVNMENGTPRYELLGDGITAITEEMNAEEETKQYIHQKNPTNQVKSYQRSFEVDKEDCADDHVQKWIDGLVDTLPVGKNAETSYIRFRLKDEVESEIGKEYKAIKVPCTITVVSAGGDAGDYVHNVISVKQCGKQIEGTFDLLTKSFSYVPEPPIA